MQTETLTNQRTDTADRLDQLRRQRGKARLDGGDTAKITAEIERAEADLASLVEAESEAVLRERDAAAKAEQARFAESCTECRAQYERRLKAVADAEKATNDLTAALIEAKDASEKMYAILVRESIRPEIPASLHEMERVLSEFVSLALSKVTGHGKFGGITLHLPPTLSPRTVIQNWRAYEENRITSAFKQLLQQ